VGIDSKPHQRELLVVYVLEQMFPDVEVYSPDQIAAADAAIAAFSPEEREITLKAALAASEQRRLAFRRFSSMLFHEIWTDLGEATARRIFTEIAGPRTPSQEVAFRNQELLDHYDAMMPNPNIQELARQLTEANKTLPVGCRYGPRGTTDSFVMEKQIRRLVARRRAK
jgi:hypothetical protein